MGLNTHSQLALNLGLNDEAKFQNFLDFGFNAEVLKELKGQAPMMFLWGGLGVGRTHLLQSLCHNALEENGSSIYIPLLSAKDLSPDILLGIEMVDIICLDDIHTVLNQFEWEEALFQFYNKVKESGSRLIISAHQSPQKLKFILADLQSRLSALPVFKLPNLDEGEQTKVLRHRASRRGIELNDAVLEFILTRSKRSMHDLIAVLDVLDSVSLVEKRRITIPLVNKAMNW